MRFRRQLFHVAFGRQFYIDHDGTEILRWSIAFERNEPSGDGWPFFCIRFQISHKAPSETSPFDSCLDAELCLALRSRRFPLAAGDRKPAKVNASLTAAKAEMARPTRMSRTPSVPKSSLLANASRRSSHHCLNPGQTPAKHLVLHHRALIRKMISRLAGRTTAAKTMKSPVHSDSKPATATSTSMNSSPPRPRKVKSPSKLLQENGYRQ